MGKTAFITGGSRGIGSGIAQVLAGAGYDIAFTYNTKLDEAVSLQKEIEALGRRCFYYQASLQEADVPEKITARAIGDLGGLDVMVCNAGQTVHTNLLEMDEAQMDFTYSLDFRSYILCAKTAARHMIDSKIQGSIIFITSTRGIRAYPEDPLYGGMKAALHRACESLALEFSRYGIRVNCVAPGATRVRGEITEESLHSGFAWKIPAKRFGTPGEVGGLVRYLVSYEAAYITGTVVKMDGGLILPGMPEDESPEAGYAWSALPERLR